MSDTLKAFKRSMSFDYRSEQNEADDRTIELSFSSTEPYQRWMNAAEVLLHGKDNVDLTRLKNKAPILYNHDWNRQIGVVEAVWLDKDKGRAKIRFSRNGLGDEVYQDIKDGIIANVSVGYHVDESEYDKERKLSNVTRWMPYELSIVSVPADISVGVGRSFNEVFQENPDQTNKERVAMTDKTENQVTSNDDLLKRDRARSDAIQALASKHGMLEFARSYVGDGSSFNQFETAMYKKMAESNYNRALLDERKKMLDTTQVESSAIGMSDKEVKNFSILKAVRAMIDPSDMRARENAKMEFEASDTFKREHGIYESGFAIPSDVLTRTFMVSGEGGKIVPTDYQASSFIDMLRNRSVMMGLCQRLSGLKGNVQIPRQTGGSNVYWVGEGEEVGQGDIKLGSIDLTPKTLGVYLDISEQMMLNATPDAESLVRNDLVAALGLGIDSAALYGKGGETKEPTGLFNSGVDVFDYVNTSPEYSDYVALETAIATSNADVNAMAYLINPYLRGLAKTTSRKLNLDQSIWERGNTINGYQTQVTNQVQQDHIIFGNFKDFIIGLWSGLILKTDPYTKIKSGILTIVARQHIDFAVRRNESFAIAQKTQV
ncbi:phage major capsid protein [Thiotrichales bacterium 19S3-7]|nr:phage major capsid protein [Thiotrichales bacterium 19S3-7]MCF6802789.1 phage major capsid protein [Thiotrichales bacterium 19S3-11]